MYETGEIFEVMTSFEKALKSAPVYAGNCDRAAMIEITKANGLTSKRFTNDNYYNNGHVNSLFLLFLHGYAFGKCVGRLQAA